MRRRITIFTVLLLGLALPASGQNAEPSEGVPVLTGYAGSIGRFQSGKQQLSPTINPILLVPLGERWLIEVEGEFEGEYDIESSDLVVSGSATSSPSPAFGQPGAVRPVNLPRLRISSVGGVSVPDTQAGVTGIVEVQLPTTNPPTNPMAIVVATTSIPDGTTITVSLKTTTGAETTANTALAPADFGTVRVNMTVPTGATSYLQAYSATFTLSAELQGALPLFNGERLMRAAVEFDGERDHYFFTASGKRVSAETLLAAC